MDCFLFFLCGLISMILGIFLGGLYFYIKERKKSLSWLNRCSAYEHAYQSLSKDLERELSIRKNIEERLQNNEEILRKFYVKLALSEEHVSSLLSYQQKYNDIVDELRIQSELSISQKVKISQMVLRLEEKNTEILKNKEIIFDFENRFSEKFEVLVNRIFEYSEKKMDVQNQSSLNSLLSPLYSQLENFNQEIKKRFSQEECERHTLSHEIQSLQSLNKKMVQETVNLTQALKGNNKMQGNWGEVILNRVLEASGMREGHEFHTQVNIQRGEDGRRLQPDVIVHLPDNKSIIIDSKMSLLDYEKYFNAEHDYEKKGALSNHIASLRSHMKLLAKKDYQSLYFNDVEFFNYVLMFIPIESAFMIAVNKDPSLLTEAMGYNIMLVSPSTLLVVLGIINNLWSYEYQNRHTKEIADMASRLYDKIRLFVDDINKLGQSLTRAQDSYSLAKRKLCEGSGNLVKQAEKFRMFGVNVKRPIISKEKLFSSSKCIFSNQIDIVSSSDIDHSCD